MGWLGAMTPPEALRYAAELLEKAHDSRDCVEVQEALMEVRETCARMVDAIDAYQDSGSPESIHRVLAGMIRLYRCS